MPLGTVKLEAYRLGNMAEGGQDLVGQVPLSQDVHVPSTLSQLHEIANRPADSIQSVWGDRLSHDGRPPAVPATIAAAAAAASANDAPSPMGVVKNVRVQAKHQIASLVPREHYEISTSVPFVKPAEIAAALIAAGLITTREWVDNCCHYQYDNNFVHYLSVPASAQKYFDEAEEKGT